MDTIPDRLKYLIKEVLKTSQTDFAAKADINVRSLNSILKRHYKNPRPEILGKICVAHGINYDWLISGNEPIFTAAKNKISDEKPTWRTKNLLDRNPELIQLIGRYDQVKSALNAQKGDAADMYEVIFKMSDKERKLMQLLLEIAS